MDTWQNICDIIITYFQEEALDMIREADLNGDGMVDYAGTYHKQM